jgi:hypothetical protein
VAQDATCRLNVEPEANSEEVIKEAAAGGCSTACSPPIPNELINADLLAFIKA